MSGTIQALIDDYEKQFNPLEELERNQLVKKWRTFLTLLIADVFLCFFVIGPAVVAVWRGVWDFPCLLLEEYEVDPNLSNGVAFSVGFTLTLLIDLYHSEFRRLAGRKGTLAYSTATRTFSTVWGLVDIFLWKGVWDGLTHLAGDSWEVSVTTLIIGTTVLTLTGTLKSGLSMPIGIVVDSSEEHICSLTYLDTSKKDCFLRRLLDGLVSRLLEITVCLSWHGTWTLLDYITMVYLSWSYQTSALFSLLTGFCGMFIVFILEFPLLYLADRINKRENLPIFWMIINVIFVLMGIFVTISCFRGFWYSLDVFYLPGHKYISYISASIIGYLVLLSMGCISNMHAGIYKDDPRLGISIAFYYLSHKFVQTIKVELSSRELDAEELRKLEKNEDDEKLNLRNAEEKLERKENGYK